MARRCNSSSPMAWRLRLCTVLHHLARHTHNTGLIRENFLPRLVQDFFHPTVGIPSVNSRGCQVVTHRSPCQPWMLLARCQSLHRVFGRRSVTAWSIKGDKHPSSDGLHPRSDGLYPRSDGLQPTSFRFLPPKNPKAPRNILPYWCFDQHQSMSEARCPEASHLPGCDRPDVAKVDEPLDPMDRHR